MIAVAPALEAQAIEPAKFSARLHERHPEILGQAEGTKGVDEHLHARSPLPRPHQRGPKGLADPVGGEDVHLQSHGAAGSINGSEHLRESFITRPQPAKISA